MNKELNGDYDIIEDAVNCMDHNSCRKLVRKLFVEIARRKIRERHNLGVDVVLSEIGEKFQSYMSNEMSQVFFESCANAGIDARKPKFIDINTSTVGSIVHSVNKINEKKGNVHAKKGKASLREEW